jgi:hypothetical protein
MAKAKGKTKGSATLAAAMARTSDALVAFAVATVAVAQEGVSRSAACVASIVELREACATPAEFATAHVSLLGNRDKTKAGRIVGTLRPILEAKKVDDGTIRTLLKEWRTFAENVDVSEVRDAGIKSGLRAAYNVVMAAQREAKGTANPNPNGETKAKPISRLELIAAWLKEDGSAEPLLGMIESALAASKDPIRAKVVHDARIQIAA